MARRPQEEWDKAREHYEINPGATLADIAELMGLLEETVEKRYLLEGWSKRAVDVPTEPEPQVDDSAEMVARIAQLEAELAATSPTKEIPEFTEANVAEQLTDEDLMPAIEDKLLAERVRRDSRGLKPLDVNDPMYESTVQRMLAEERAERIEQQTKWATNSNRGIRTRTAKMVTPNGVRVQCILEPHVNSATGNANDGLAFYRAKGYQLETPQKCLLLNCWKGAHVVNGQLAARGMCDIHADLVLPIQNAPLAGASTSAMASNRAKVTLGG